MHYTLVTEDCRTNCFTPWLLDVDECNAFTTWLLRIDE